MRKDNGYNNFKKYQVKDVSNIEEFLLKYTKRNRHYGRGEEYAQARIKSFTEEFNKYGYCFMTHHESTTGETVSFYG